MYITYIYRYIYRPVEVLASLLRSFQYVFSSRTSVIHTHMADLAKLL